MWNDARLELSAQDGLEEVPVIETTQETAMQGIQCYTPGFASGDIFCLSSRNHPRGAPQGTRILIMFLSHSTCFTCCVRTHGAW